MTFKKIAAVALAVLTAVSAQADLPQVSRYPLAVSRTTSGTAYTYCTLLGADVGPFASPVGPWKRPKPSQLVKTPDTSDTTIAEVTDTDPWTNVAAGDLVRFSGNKPAADNERVMVTRTSASSAVFNRVIDLDIVSVTNTAETLGFQFQYRTLSCVDTTPTAAAGYIPVGNYEAGNFLLVAEAEASATNGLDYQLVCYVGGASIVSVIVASGNITQAQAAAKQAVAIGEWNIGNYGFSHCALGVQADAGTVTYSAYFIAKDAGN